MKWWNRTGFNLIYFFFTNPNQLTHHERISSKRCKNLFTEFPLHIQGLYGSKPYLQKYETAVQVSVKRGIILTCKTECKGWFRSRKACKHHRATLRELAKVKPRFFHLIYHPHSCEINLRQLVATFNRLPVWKYVKRSWAPHILFFFTLPLNVLTFHFFFVTDNIHKWQRGDHLFPREQFFDTVSYGPTLS